MPRDGWSGRIDCRTFWMAERYGTWTGKLYCFRSLMPLFGIIPTELPRRLSLGKWLGRLRNGGREQLCWLKETRRWSLGVYSFWEDILWSVIHCTDGQGCGFRDSLQALAGIPEITLAHDVVALEH